jgi:glutamate-1-semialdehyde 2,1-aminomutase
MTTTNTAASTEQSRVLAERARAVIPSGVTHDMRFLRPYPIYIDRAEGSRKTDVDGNEYVDYWMGHGSLLLGHRHPTVMRAVAAAMDRATHAGGCHDLEVEWAERVVEMFASADQVRFTASGTEATMLALRLARAFADRPRIVKFDGHFHGWHDYATYGVNPPYDRPTSIGVPRVLDETITVIPPDLERLAVELRRGDVAGVILEPTGASMGAIPPWTRRSWVRSAGRATRPARCSSWTRSSPDSATPPAACRSSPGCRPTSRRSGRCSPADCRAAASRAVGT